MLAFILWGSIFAALFYYFAVKPMSYWKKRGVIQGNPVWLAGDSLGIMMRRESFYDMMKRIYDRFKNVRYSGAYLMTTPTLVIHDPELIKLITVKDFDYFLDHRNLIPEDVDPFLGKNLFALRGQKWREMRPILSPSFTSSKMKSMFVVMAECMEGFVKHFSAKSEDVIRVDMKDVFTRLGNDIIASTAFGIKVDSLERPENDFYLMGKEVTNFSGWWMNIKFFALQVSPALLKAFNMKIIDDKVTSYFYSIIEETIKAREKQNIVRQDMIQLLMDARKGKQEENEVTVLDTGFATVQEATIAKANDTKQTDLTTMDIASHAMIFFFAGFDSVTNLMSFMAYELGLNPDIQDRLREEIKETDAACKGKVTYEALIKMKYLDMVVSESLRKWPINPFTDRVCTRPYTIQPASPGERPLELEVGTVITIPILGLQRDPRYYPNPEKFDPERFSDENKSKIDPYTYLAFGLGPRNCIGSRFALLETKILFYYLLREFEIVPTESTPIPAVVKKTLNLTIEGGFKLGLKPVK